MKSILSFLVLFLSFCYSFAQKNDWTAVEKVFGKKGTVQDDVLKITFPRTDLKVKVGDFPVAPGLALTTWIGFVNSKDSVISMNNNETTMMGDIVLLDQEVETAVKKIIEEDLEINAIHNHLIGETPQIKYIHFSCSGDAVKLAEKIKAVLMVTATPMTSPPGMEIKVKPDWSSVLAILGKTGKQNGMLLQYLFPREESITDNDMDMPPYMGMATAINFQMEGTRTAIFGDFVLMSEEVNVVAKTLTQYGISVTAIHNHMLEDYPRLFMMHFWAVDYPDKLAKGLRAALEQTNSITNFNL